MRSDDFCLQRSDVARLAACKRRQKSDYERRSHARNGWQHFHHDADIGVCGRGRTVEEAFEPAALALTGVVADKPVAGDICVEVSCRQSDIQPLFVDWLDAIIFGMATRKMLFGRFAVQIDGLTLTGKTWGEPVDVARHSPACEPKGATLTELKVSRDAEGLWSARCVIDV